MRLCLLVAVVLVPLSPAAADPVQESATPMAAGMSHGSVRSKAKKSMLMPAGALTVGADVGFVTADAGFGPGELRFTDVMLFRPRLRYAPGDEVELFAGTTVLAKQPSFTDEPLWQGGHAGVLVGLGSRAAVFAQAGGGPLTGDNGWWAGADLGMQARKSFEEIIVFQGALGGAGSYLIVDDDTEEAFWFAEVAAHGEVLFQSPRNVFAFWLGMDYRVPVVSNPSEPDPLIGAYLDPQIRVNVQLGFTVALLDGWDIFAEYLILDRGDVTAPATTLPILEGGFDQRHIVIGLLRRFDTRAAPRALIAR